MDYNDVAKNFGFRVKMIRMKQGFSQAKLAEILNSQEYYISNIERGKVNITLKTINKLATALVVKESKFFNFEE